MRFFYIISFFLLAQTSSFAQSISGVVNIYRKVLWADSATASLKLSSTGGLEPYIGNKVMLVQMKGATIDQTNASSFGNITATNNVGYYEIGTICGFKQDTMILERKFNNKYDATDRVQCVIMPKFTGNVTVTDTLKAEPWDSVAGTGGIVALDVPGTLFLNKPVSASGAGFRGGLYQLFSVSCTFTTGVTAYFYANTATTNNNGAPKGEGIVDFIATKENGRGKQANGGGGGNNHNSGGAGGSNYGSGGQGGNRVGGSCTSNTPGQGGLALSSTGYALSPATQNRIFMGGGGGCGHDNSGTGMSGGHGGGIVYISANRIEGNSSTAGDNKILANGAVPYRYITIWGFGGSDAGSDGGGGGGGGGCIILKVNTFGGNAITAEANGANGGGTETFGQNQCSGPGGGGGGGVVWFSGASLPSGITTAVAGGTNGTTSSTASCANSANSAASGAAGTTLFNFALATPKDTSPVCKQVLPLQADVQLAGQQHGNERRLTATVSSSNPVQACILQKALPGSNDFTEVQRSNRSQTVYTFTEVDNMPALYRVMAITATDGRAYSGILRFGAATGKGLVAHIFPNPVRQGATLQVYTAANGQAQINILNAQGALLQTYTQNVTAGYNTLYFNIAALPAGTLFVKVAASGQTVVVPFIKLDK